MRLLLTTAICLLLNACNTNGSCSRAYVISKAPEASIVAPEDAIETVIEPLAE